MQTYLFCLISLIWELTANTTDTFHHVKFNNEYNYFEPRVVADDILRPIRGTVKNTNNEVIINSNINLYSNQGDLLASTTTDGAGRFYFSPVVQGYYSITVTASGCQGNPTEVVVYDMEVDVTIYMECQ